MKGIVAVVLLLPSSCSLQIEVVEDKTKTPKFKTECIEGVQYYMQVRMAGNFGLAYMTVINLIRIALLLPVKWRYHMNDKIDTFARGVLKDGLTELLPTQQDIFKRMYGKQLPDNKGVDLSVDINVVVDEMPSGKLDWAMEQVEATINKNRIKV